MKKEQQQQQQQQLLPLQQKQQPPSSSRTFKPDDNLPTNVSSADQLVQLPLECLNVDSVDRPLRHCDDLGHEYFYSLQPMKYCVLLILLVELLERFCYYGIDYTQTLYLTGAYDKDWNAGLGSVGAASFVSLSTAVAYTTPFLGALLADTLVGDYKTIVLGAVALYLPGVFLLVLTTIPHLLGTEFNRPVFGLALLFFWPMGTGILKSVINVFGAKQFHPIVQSSFIESYYVNFYMCINIGALAGIIIVPIMAQKINVTIAYMVPLVLLTVCLLLFLAGTQRYVRTPPRRGDLTLVCCHNNNKKTTTTRRSNNKTTTVTTETISLFTIFRLTVLIVPFCIGYSQLPTTFIVQGTVMKKALNGYIDAATMNCADAISVLLFGYVTGNQLYPALARRNIKLKTTHKFAIGSALGACAILWALFVEHKIHYAFHFENGRQISVLWQVLSYVFIGWGEIFAVSAAYEVAFTASPPDKKVLASAVNIFCVGGIPNFICIFLYTWCRPWFLNRHGESNISELDQYAYAHVNNYFWVLFCILVAGIVLNLLPCVSRFVESIETKAADLIKTPVFNKKKLHQLQQQKQQQNDPQTRSFYTLDSFGSTATPSSTGGGGEESPLLVRCREQVGGARGPPVLYKMGSMRAGPTLGHDTSKPLQIKYKYIPDLYSGGGGVAAPSTTTDNHQRDSQGGEQQQRQLDGSESVSAAVMMGPDGRKILYPSTSLPPQQD